MYKHSTTHRTLSRRLAALLAVLALLAAMALPVYADALEDATQMQETVETGNNVETGSDVETDDKSETEDTGTGTESEDTNDNASSNTTGDSNTTAGNAANDTPQTLPTDSIDTAAGKTTTNGTLDTMNEETKQNIVTRSTDDAETADDETADDMALYDGVTTDEYFDIYFALPKAWEGAQKISFEALRGNHNDGSTGTKEMTLVDGRGTTADGKKIYKINLHYKQGDTSVDCPYKGFAKITFTKDDDTTGISAKLTVDTNDSSVFWQEYETLKDRYYDSDKQEWISIAELKPRHTHFANKTFTFKNMTANDLTNVKAIFYDKAEGSTELTLVKAEDFTVSAKGNATVTIPNAACAYVAFFVDDVQLGNCFNFCNDDSTTKNVTPFLYSESQNCFVYTTSGNSGNVDLPEDSARKIYYDATFSKLDAENSEHAIPNTSGNVHYHLWNSKNTSETYDGVMEKADNTGNLYVINGVDSKYDHIIFSNNAIGATNGYGSRTGDLTIPSEDTYVTPCFYADTSDDVAYKNTTRDGYWAEVKITRDAEKGKSTDNNQRDVVKVNKDTFVADSATKYISTTLYDYYTDYELNGNSRTTYDSSEGANDRNWITFREFDQAISDYYRDYDKDDANTNKILYPIYTGHFQPSVSGWGNRFSSIANNLALYGWADSGEKYKAFVSANNSAGNEGSGEKDRYDYAFQGIVASELSDTGDLLMNSGIKGTNASTTLAEPHFNESFILGKNSKNAKLGEVYHNVSFPFTKAQVFPDEPGINYWWYDSSRTSLYLREDSDTKQLYLGNDGKDGKTAGVTDSKSDNLDSAGLKYNEYSDAFKKKSDVTIEHGFFPFNESMSESDCASKYNYGYGAKLEIPFSITENGKVESTSNGVTTQVPIRYYFSGDDDVWVFIDGKLVLDVGGAHGKVSGILDFSQENGENENKVTAYVSKVKYNRYIVDGYGPNEKYHDDTDKQISIAYRNDPENLESAGVTTDYYQKNTVTIDGLTTGTHTLTMYYMERGMWESNMAVAFNFPDNNELQVEKKVELGDVTDEEFKACFTNQKLFNFTILNQATHYGTTRVDESSYQQAEPIVLSNTENHLGRIKPRENDNNYYCKLDADPDKKNTGQVIHWYAKYNDTGSDYRDDRMGVITLKSTVDITGMDYLSFFLYASGKEGEGTLSLSNMYLQLVDSNGKVLGCIDKQSLSGTTYNLVDPENNKWINIKLDLSRLIKAPNPNFDMTKLKEIRIGDNYQRDIYFKDFTFTANPTIQKITGFTTEQDKIPDYDSAKTGELKPAVNAQFSSSVDGKTRAVDKNGQFTLQDKEVVTFSDQFRRGSYLSVTEDADPALFDTTWTIYENGVPVTSMNTGTTVENAIPVPNVVGVSSYTPNDGRIEKPNIEEATQSKNAYKNAEKPAGDKTIVFRSYSSPDSGENGNLAKLKLQFVNKVKTGSLTIKKEAAENESDQIKTGTYTFTVTFTDVGGLGLESKPIKEKVEITGIGEKIITGIPVGTRFHIEETTASNNANVSKVEVTGGGDDRAVVNGKEAIGSIVEYKQDKPSTVAVATFTNTTRTLINIDLTKKWFDAAGNELTDNTLPETVYVQLQRKTENKSDLDWKPVGGTDQNYVAVNRDQRGWTHCFTNLDANDYTSTDDTKPVYQYRVVEGVLEKGVFVAKNPETDALLLSDGYTYTYNGNEMQTTTTADGKTSNTITLTNKRLDPKFALDITKKDAENGRTLLKDVEFTLEKLDENNEVVAGSAKCGITNDQGKLMIKDADGNPTTQPAFTGLEAGKYRLTETKAAKDYNLLSAPIEVEFTKTGQCLLNGVAVNVSTTDKPTDFTKNGNDSYTLKLTVLNRKTPALPHTGADAPSLWLLIGLPLAVAGLLILVFRYNKKGGRTR